MLYLNHTREKGSKAKETLETPWQRLVQTAQKNEAENKHLEILGLGEVTGLEDVYPAFHKQSQQYSKKARKTMTPNQRKEAVEKMKLLIEAKKYFEQKFPRIWQAPTGKHRRYRPKN